MEPQFLGPPAPCYNVVASVGDRADESLASTRRVAADAAVLYGAGAGRWRLRALGRRGEVRLDLARVARRRRT